MAKGNFYGNKATHVLHNSKRGDSCRASEIKPDNLEKYATVEDAMVRGYRCCKRCKWDAK